MFTNQGQTSETGKHFFFLKQVKKKCTEIQWSFQ
jgi:hypothetical protein